MSLEGEHHAGISEELRTEVLDDGSFLFPQLLQVHPHLSEAIREMTDRNPGRFSFSTFKQSLRDPTKLLLF